MFQILDPNTFIVSVSLEEIVYTISLFLREPNSSPRQPYNSKALDLQVGTIVADDPRSVLPIQYLKQEYIFLEENASILAQHFEYNYVIDLEPNAKPSHLLIYSLL